MGVTKAALLQEWVTGRSEQVGDPDNYVLFNHGLFEGKYVKVRNTIEYNVERKWNFLTLKCS